MEPDRGPVHPVPVPKVTPRFKRQPKYRRTFLREWREFRGLTLEQLADRLGTTHATLSRIERALIPYSQSLLEAAAVALRCEPADLLVRNPNDPEGIWTVWEKALPGERAMIVDLAKTLTKRAG